MTSQLHAPRRFGPHASRRAGGSREGVGWVATARLALHQEKFSRGAHPPLREKVVARKAEQ